MIDALAAEKLTRSMLWRPTRSARRRRRTAPVFHRAGVPSCNFLAAPFYLFDAMDTLDKIDRDNLVPLSRAAIRIVASTAGCRRPTCVLAW